MGSLIELSAFAPRPELRLVLERSLPEELALAQVMSDPAREHEEQVGEAVQGLQGPLADVLVAHEAEHVALRAPAHGARHVVEWAHLPAIREHERPYPPHDLLAPAHERNHLIHV